MSKIYVITKAVKALISHTFSAIHPPGFDERDRIKRHNNTSILNQLIPAYTQPKSSQMQQFTNITNTPAKFNRWMMTLALVLFAGVSALQAQTYFTESFEGTWYLQGNIANAATAAGPNAPNTWKQTRVVNDVAPPISCSSSGGKDWGQLVWGGSAYTSVLNTGVGTAGCSPFGTAPGAPPAGSNVMWFYDGWASSGNTRRIESPSINLSAAVAPIISYSYSYAGAGVSNLVGSLDGGTTWNTLSTLPTTTAGVWSLRSFEIPPAYKIATAKFGFQIASTFGSNDVYIDNVIVREGITADAAPTSFNPTLVTATGMTIGWTDNSTNETGFNIYRSTDNVTFVQIGTTIASTTSVGTGTTYSSVQTSLLPGITYFYRIAAVTESESAFLTGSQATTAAGNIVSTGTGGNWSATGTWVGGVLPTATDNVTIADGATVTIDNTSAVCNNLTVGQGVTGILNWSATAAGTLTVSSDVTVAAGGNFTANGTGTKSLIIGGTSATGTAAGNLTVNGTFNLGVSNSVFVTTTFRGVTNGTVSGAGSINFGGIVVNKGAASTPVIDITVPVTMLAPIASANRLVITNGTFKLSSASAITPYYGAQTVCTSTGRLWLNNAGASVQWVGTGTATGTGTVTVSGILQMSSGTFGSGSGSTSLTFSSATGILNMTGGTLNHFGPVSFSSSAGTQLNLSGGNINVDVQAGASSTTAAFTIGISTTVNWSGGIITLVDPPASSGFGSWAASSGGVKNITGGTLRIGDGISTTSGGTLSNTSGFGINSGMSIWNLEINNRTDASTSRMARITATSYILNNIEIKANGYLFNGSGATTNTIVLSGNLINNGTFAGTEPGGTQNIGTIQFSGVAGTETVTGSGSFVNLGSLSIANTASGVSFNQTNQYNTLRVNRFQGNVINANKLTIGLGGATASTVQYGLVGGIVPAGTFDVAPTFNLGSGAYTLLYNQESVARTIGLEVPATRTAGSMTVSNTNGVILSGGPLTLSGTLALTSGIVTTTAANLLTAAGTITGGSLTSYVNGPLARTLPASTAAGTFVFPVGKGTYNPFELLSANTTAGGTVDVRAEVFDANAGGTPGALMGAINTSRYWAASITAGSANFTNALVKLNDTRGTQDAVAASATLSGAYNQIGGVAATLATGSIATTAPAVTSLPGFFLMGNLGAASVSGLTITPATAQCVNVARDITAIVTPGGGAVSTVVINYSVNGTAQTAITMNNTGGNNWAGTIPTVSPANGSVTWTVVATDVNTLTGSASGPAYKDEPLTGVTAAVSASANPVCSGSPVQLTATLTSSASATIGVANTLTALTAQPTAFCNRWPSYRMQTIFTAGELITAGLSAGNITSMSFNIASLGSASFTDNFIVKIGTTANSTVSAFESNAAYTTVFPAQTYNHVVGVNVITFSTPYVWNGTSNIIVEVEHEGADATNNAETYFTATGGNTVAYTSTDASNSASLSPNRLNVTFTGAAAPAISSVLWSNGSTTNPITVNPVGDTSFTAAITASGCTVNTGAINLSVYALPNAPTGIISSQCGVGTPTVTANGGGIGTYRWYLVPTGGTAIDGQTNGTLTDYPISIPTTFYVSILDSNSTCESARTSIFADVSIPDAITAVSSSSSVCANNAGIDLSITQVGANQTYSFTWTATPELGSGITGSVSGAAITGFAGILPTLPGTYLYTVTGVAGTCTTTSSISVTVQALPILNAATATPDTICAGASVTLTATTATITAGAVVLGAGGTNSSSTAATFFPGGWGGAKTQYIIRAAELTALGLTAGNITSLGFEPTTSGQTYQGFAVSIGQTALTSMTTAFVTTGLTQVYAGTLANNGFTPVQNVVNTLTFGTGGTASSFAWDGTSNIVVTICWSRVPSASTSTASTMKVDATGFTSSAYEQSDNLTPGDMCAKVTADGTGTLRPRFTINGQLLSVGAGSLNWSWDNGGGTGNTVSVTPSATTTYTVTALDNVTGCSDTSQVLVVVNPIPAEPTGATSEQCGTIVPTAAVSSNSGAVTPIFAWYANASGGTALQTSASTTYTDLVAATTTFYVSEISEFGCESTRVPVVITVASPDPILAAATSLSLCPQASFDISSTYTQDFNVYGQFILTVDNETGSGITNPVDLTANAGGSDPYAITPTVPGTYVYTITAVDNDKTCSAISTVTIVVNPIPSITSVEATPSTICEGSTLTLTAKTIASAPGTRAIGAGASTSSSSGTPFYGTWGGTKVQYIYTATELTSAGLGAGNITSLGLNVTSVGATTYNGFGISIGATAQSVYATANAVTGLTQVYTGPLANNGVQTTVGLNTYTFATPFAWNGTDNIVVSICYSNANGSNPATTIQTDTYTGFNRTMYIYADNQTPATVCDANTTIPASGGSATSTLRPKTTFGGVVAADQTSTNTWVWNPGAVSAGTTGITTVVATPSITEYIATATNSFGCSANSTPVAVIVNPAPLAPDTTNSTQCGVGVPTAAVSGAGGTFKWYNAASAGTLLQTGGNTYTGTIAATTSFFVSETSAAGCEGPRIELVAEVTAPPALTITASAATTFCEGLSVSLDAAVNSDVSYGNFTWTTLPLTGAGLSANTGSVITSTPTVAGTYTISVSANNVSGCTNTASIAVTMNANPVITSFTATPASICVGASSTLKAESVGSANTAAVGAGVTATSTTTTIGTLYGTYYGNGHTQVLYRASELLAAGFNAGNITSLGIQLSSIGNGQAVNGFTVKIAATTEIAITTFQSASFNTVYGPVDYTPVLGLNTNTFTTPFAWDGTSNIIVDYCFANGISGTSAMTKINTYTTTAFGSFVNYQADGTPATAPCDAVTVSNTSSNRPNLIFTIQNDLTNSYTWSFNPGAVSGGNTGIALVSPIATTSYTATAISAAGCSSTTVLPVQVAVVPVAAGVTASANPLCSGLSTTLSANATGGGPFTYEWSDGVTVVGAAATLTISPSTTTIYTVTVRDACNNPVTSSLQVDVIASPVINAGADVSFCFPGGTPAALSVSGAVTYTWAPADGLSATTGSTVNASPAATTAYVVTGTAANGCLDTDTVIVTVNAGVINLVTTAPPTIECAGVPVQIGASAGTFGPASQYVFSTATGGALDPMTGAVTIVSSGVDDAPMNTTSSSTAGNAVPIGFDFNFGGANYTYFSASPDGWLSLANTTTPAVSSFSNGVTTATNLPKVYPYWDDMATGTTGNITSVVTGTSPNRILKVQWFVTIPRNTTGAANSTFQAWLYESGKVEFHYGAMNTGSMSASVGITGTVAQYRSVTVSNNTSSNSTANNSNAGQPASGRSYTFNLPQVTNFSWMPGSLTGATVSVAPAVTTLYTVTATTAAGCSQTATVNVEVTNCPPLWTGATSTEWNTGTNWRRGSAPLAGEDVTIGTSVAGFYPVLTGDVTVGGSLDILSGATLNIAANTLTVTGGVTANTGLLIGSHASNLMLGATSSLRFSQTGTNGLVKNLNVNAGTATLLAPLAITGGTGGTNNSTFGTVTVAQGAVLASGGNLTFKSNIAGTARLAEGAAAGNYVTGNVTVERYIPANRKRAWRMLSVPTISTQKINDAWQEGVSGAGLNPVPGFGTLITTNLAGPIPKGFDVQTPKASLQTFNSATNSFVNVLATKGAGNIGDLTTNKGYSIFIRGNRGGGGQVTSPDTVTSPTVLRTTGTLYTGTQTPISIVANRYELIGNTYVSAIDFLQLAKTGINSTLYIWDAKATTGTSLGAYQTFNPINGYLPLLPGSYGAGTVESPFVANTLVESGQAFLVQAGASGGSIGMVEAAKTVGTGVNMFRPTAAMGKIKTNLYKLANSTAVMVDANIAAFAEGYSNEVDGDDAAKLANSGENFGIIRNNLNLVIEARQPVVENDTTQFKMWSMTQSQYRLEFIPTEMNVPGLTAILKDRFTGTSTPLDLTGTSVYNFSISADAASAEQNRFSIVYKQVQAGPLPVTFVSISANRVGAAVKVDWKVAGERNIRGYEVERSADGIRFASIGNVMAIGNNGNDLAYNFTDAAPMTGTGFYRIKSTGVAGDVKYTYIVRISIGNVKPGYTVSPNPVEGSVVNVQFKNQPKGKYNIRLLSPIGQVIFTSVAEHAGGNSSQLLNLPTAIARGAYQLEITAPDFSKNVQSLLINTNK